MRGKAEVNDDTNLSCTELESIVMPLTETGNRNKKLTGR